jgi:uncharacterized protein YjaG (DUF416 family)
MYMLDFDEVRLTNRLEKMNPIARVVFAASCATRLLPSFEEYALSFSPNKLGTLRKVLDQIWLLLARGMWHDSSLQDTLEEVMAIIPEEHDSWTPLHAYAEDAVAATAYTLRTLLSSDAKEAGWAARRCYEAVDLAAQGKIDFQPGNKNSEFQLLSHPLIQSELARQEEDMSDLECLSSNEDVFSKIRERALSQPALEGQATTR